MELSSPTAEELGAAKIVRHEGDPALLLAILRPSCAAPPAARKCHEHSAATVVLSQWQLSALWRPERRKGSC